MTPERKAELRKLIEAIGQESETALAQELLTALDSAESQRDQLQAKLAEIGLRLPDCPPCDMGENTKCVCKAELVPKPWMDEIIKERDKLQAELAEKGKEVERMRKIGMDLCVAGFGLRVDAMALISSLTLPNDHVLNEITKKFDIPYWDCQQCGNGSKEGFGKIRHAEDCPVGQALTPPPVELPTTEAGELRDARAKAVEATMRHCLDDIKTWLPSEISTLRFEIVAALEKK